MFLKIFREMLSFNEELNSVLMLFMKILKRKSEKTWRLNSYFFPGKFQILPTNLFCFSFSKFLQVSINLCKIEGILFYVDPENFTENIEKS